MRMWIWREQERRRPEIDDDVSALVQELFGLDFNVSTDFNTIALM